MVTGDIKLHVDASAPDGESVRIQYGSGRGCKYWYINSLGTLLMVNGRRDLYTSAGYPLASKQAMLGPIDFN